MVDVLIAGGGPAGWALASACARRGSRVTLVAATHAWPATYGMWADETGVLPPGARWRTSRPRGMARDYVVLDNDSVLAAFAHPGIGVVTGRVRGTIPGGVRLAGGEELRAAMVIDATGAAAALTGGPRSRLAETDVVDASGAGRGRRDPGEGRHHADRVDTARPAGRRARIEQTAFGVVVPAEDAVAVVGPGEAVFMDWRQPPGFGEPATFLYAVPLPDGRVLLEETCLARRPGLGFGELRDRLHARLRDQPDAVTRSGPTGTKVPLVRPGTPRFPIYRRAPTIERVRFPVDVPPPPRWARGAIPFGAAAGFVHPATGFSLGDTFRLAPLVADTIGRGAGAVRRVLWPERARVVYRLRRRGLATLLSLTAAEHKEFFDLFFALPDRLQRAYLSGRTDVAGTAAAMAAMFRAAPAHLRRKMINP